MKLSFNLVLYFQEWDPQTPGLAVCTRSESEVRAWCEEVAAQRILLTTPSVLLGERLSVYRVEGTTQWYSAFIIGVNQETGVSSDASLIRESWLLGKEFLIRIVKVLPFMEFKVH